MYVQCFTTQECSQDTGGFGIPYVDITNQWGDFLSAKTPYRAYKSKETEYSTHVYAYKCTSILKIHPFNLSSLHEAEMVQFVEMWLNNTNT